MEEYQRVERILPEHLGMECILSPGITVPWRIDYVGKSLFVASRGKEEGTFGCKMPGVKFSICPIQTKEIKPTKRLMALKMKYLDEAFSK